MHLDEKSTSVAQQHAMGAALNAKRTGKPTFPLAQRLADAMTEKQLEDFAATKHDGLPARRRPQPVYDEGVSRHPRPAIYDEDGRFKSFERFVSELESGGLPRYDEADNPSGDTDDDEGDMSSVLGRDDAIVVALNELGLITKSELDPQADAAAVAAALLVKIDLCRDKAKASPRLQALSRSNPLVHRALSDRDATVQDLVVAMSTGDDDAGEASHFSAMGDSDAGVERDDDDTEPI